jgi:DNA polymerase-3 subunit delta
MAKAVPALKYLAEPAKHAVQPVCAVLGEEPFLRRLAIGRMRDAVLGRGEAELSFTALEGPKTALRDVLDELGTLAMFGGGRRMVVVEDADSFVSNYRGPLEDYAASPIASAVLVLQLKSLPSNTRLYAAISKSGLIVDCRPPKEAELSRWLVGWTRQAHRAEITDDAIELLMEMIGPEPGLLDQELAKLALSVGADGKITGQTVKQMVGTWRAKTAWDMLDAALEGDSSTALTQLDRLLLAGENPIAILGQIAASLRRLASATSLVLQAERAGKRLPVREALLQTGLRPFLAGKVERQLRKLGRHRGQELPDWLLQADLDLKGASRLEPRLVLERLLVRLSTADPATRGAAR